MAEDEKKEEPIEDPWRGIMRDVAKMMQSALEEADDIIAQHLERGKGEISNSSPPPFPFTFPPPSEESRLDMTVRMAVAIFDATAAAEGGRRMLEAQQGVRRGGLIAIGKDGRPVTM